MTRRYSAECANQNCGKFGRRVNLPARPYRAPFCSCGSEMVVFGKGRPSRTPADQLSVPGDDALKDGTGRA